MRRQAGPVIPVPRPDAEPPELPPARVRTGSARVPALVVAVVLVVIAAAGFMGRQEARPAAIPVSTPVTAAERHSPTPSPGTAPSPSGTPRPAGDGVFGASFWLTVFVDGDLLTRVGLDPVDGGWEGTFAVPRRWRERNVTAWLEGRTPDGSALRLTDTVVPTISGRILELPLELSAGAVTYSDRAVADVPPERWQMSTIRALGRWEYSLSLERGRGYSMLLVARVSAHRATVVRSRDPGEDWEVILDGSSSCVVAVPRGHVAGGSEPPSCLPASPSAHP